MGAARKLRSSMTAGERVLWSALRSKAFGFRVRRQYSVDKYVLDFYIHAARLCIEIDGPEHDVRHDAIRDGVIGDLGIFTIRIPWKDLPDRAAFWIEEIVQLAKVRADLQPDRTRMDNAKFKLVKRKREKPST